MDKEQVDFWMTTAQPAPVSKADVAACQRKMKVELPPTYVEGMLRRNGGLVRIGRTLWALAPIPPGSAGKAEVYWSGRRVRDIADLSLVLSTWEDFPLDALAVGTCLNRGSPGPVLVLRTMPTGTDVCSWSWDSPALTPLLDDVADLWRDDPRTLPPRRCQWQVEQVRLPRSAFMDYLEGPGAEDIPPEGVRSGWLDVAMLELKSGGLALDEGLYYPALADAAVQLEPGNHALQVCCVQYTGDWRIGAVRLLRVGQDAASLQREPLAEISIDSGCLALSERPSLLAVDPEERDEVLLAVNDYVTYEHPDQQAVGISLFAFGGAPTVVVNSGFGDGCYPAFALRDGKQALGVEVEFIAEGEAYPFGDEYPAE
jgi:hypothetical protein